MHVVYCSSQLDGITAAAILFRSAHLRNLDVKLGGTLNFDTAKEQFTNMQNHKGDLIFVLDFLPDHPKELEKSLKDITVTNRIAYWNSNNPHDPETEEFLNKYAHKVELSGPLHYSPVPKEKLCSAELAQKRFLPNDTVAKDLAHLAHDIEFWERTDKRAVQLADLIASGFDVKELINSLARGVLWSEKFEQIQKEYLTKKEQALKDIMKHLVVKNILTYRFGFTLAPNLLPTADAGQHILDNHVGVDISVVLYRNGRISFRKRDECQVNLANLAEIFGGGGHVHAAGAKLTQSINREQFEQTLFDIDQKLKEHLL